MAKAAGCSSLINHCFKAAKEALVPGEPLGGGLGTGISLTEKGAESNPNLIADTLPKGNHQLDVEDEFSNDALFVGDDCGENVGEESNDNNE